MTADELRATADGLVTLHQRFAPLFGYPQAQEHAQVYLQGLLLADGRKSVEPMALVFGNGQVHALQKFLTLSPWDSQAVQQEIQAVFAEELASSTTEWSLGTVGVIDESAFAKKGRASVGVKRQWCGRLGKKENCQVGVFLVGVTPAGTALLDHQLYLPREWTGDRTRRRRTRVPKGLRFQTKPRLARVLWQRVQAAGHVAFDWLTFDEGYGRDGAFLSQLEAAGQHYVAEVPANTSVWPADPWQADRPYAGVGPRPRQARRSAGRSVREVAAGLPAEAWHTLQLRDGAAGPLVFEFACVRVWARRHKKPGPPLWLLVRRALGPEPELKYYLCHAEETVSLETLALVSGCRFRVEEFLGEGKSNLGMADYEGRSWTTWHHHMTMVALAHLLVTQTRMGLKKKVQANHRVDHGPGVARTQSGLAAPATDCRGGQRDHRLLPRPQSDRQGITREVLETPA
jgi:SRSO17 transposase